MVKPETFSGVKHHACFWEVGGNPQEAKANKHKEHKKPLSLFFLHTPELRTGPWSCEMAMLLAVSLSHKTKCPLYTLLLIIVAYRSWILHGNLSTPHGKSK